MASSPLQGKPCVYSPRRYPGLRWWLMLMTVAFAGLFFGCLVGSERLAFRDVGHFYTPLYEYVAKRCETHWIPLWNPLDQSGISLPGESTTAIFYPIRYLIYCLPIKTEMALSWYVVFHLMLASIAAAFAARLAGVRKGFGAIAGIVYPLSGAVIFLYTNPIFLVGAAWMPFVVGVMLTKRRVSPTKQIMIASPALALMVLGGDPQCALHAVLIVALCKVVAWLGSRLSGRFASATPKRPPTESKIALFKGLAILGVSCLLAAVLSLPQIVASASWASRSDRLEDHRYGEWWQPPITATRHDQSYSFSLPPWHCLSILAPNPYGRILPKYQRLTALTLADGRTWVLSIYAGTIVVLGLLLELGAIRLRRRSRWLFIAVVALCLSFGEFGLAWVGQCWTDKLDHLDSAIGGPYWVLYTFLPGYDSFRYPAKWTPFFSLAGAVLAASWSGRLPRLPNRKLLFPVAFGVVSATALFTVAWYLRYDPSFTSRSALPDMFCGPLDIDASLRQMQWSAVHSFIAITALTLVFRFAKKLQIQNYRRLLMLCVAVDAACAAKPLIFTVDLQTETQIINELSDRDTNKPNDSFRRRWLRTKAHSGWPDAWHVTTSENRLAESEASQRFSWFGKWHLSQNEAVFNSMTSIRTSEATDFWGAIKRHSSSITREEDVAFREQVKRWLAINWETHCTEKDVVVDVGNAQYTVVDNPKAMTALPNLFLQAWETWRIDDPRQSIGQRWDNLLVRVKEDAENTIPTIQVSPEGAKIEPRMSRQIVSGLQIAEEDQDATLKTTVQSMDLGVDGNPIDPEHQVIVVNATAECLVTRRAYQDGHWQAEFAPLSPDAQQDSGSWIPLTVHQVDFFAQGVFLPKGEWIVRFIYRPWWLTSSIAVFLLGWLGVAVSYLQLLKHACRGQCLSASPETDFR